jgi:hypothetical protein
VFVGVAIPEQENLLPIHLVMLFFVFQQIYLVLV